MSEVKSRIFSIMDLMILIAVTAVGLAWWRILTPFGFFHGSLGSISPGHSLREKLNRVLWVVYDLYPLVVTWTFGFLLLRLRSPRPILRRMARQPGFTAGCAVLVALASQFGEMAGWGTAVEGLWPFVIVTLRGLIFYRDALEYNLCFDQTIKQIASAVASVWGMMCLGRVLRPERSWIDRLGRALGILWIVMYLIRIGTMEN